MDVQPGDEHTPKHGQAGLWSLLHRLGGSRWPALLRGDVAWGVEPVMSRAEQEGLRYLFRLRMTANVKRALTKMMAERDWTTAGHGWQGKATTLRLVGWSRQRRVVLLRRKLDRPLLLMERTEPAQPLLSFAEVGPNREVWEYAALVTSLDSEIVTLGQLYRDRGDCENTYDAWHTPTLRVRVAPQASSRRNSACGPDVRHGWLPPFVVDARATPLPARRAN